MWSPVDPRGDLGNWRLLILPFLCPLNLSLECTFCPPVPRWQLFSRTQPWDRHVCLGPSGSHSWLNTGLHRKEFLWQASVMGCLTAPMTNLVCQSLASKPPPTELEWPLSLPSVHGSQFANHLQWEEAIVSLRSLLIYTPVFLAVFSSLSHFLPVFPGIIFQIN